MLRDVIGHKGQVRTFLNIVRGLENEGRSFIFFGPEGVGKMTSALYGCASLICEKKGEFACRECRSCRLVGKLLHPDLTVLAPESKGEWIRVSDIREKILPTLKYPPLEGEFKFYIIDRAERLNVNAQNSLLKILEEPPPKTIFILIANSLWQIIPTVRSRTVQLNFMRLNFEEFSTVLRSSGMSASEDAFISSWGSPGMWEKIEAQSKGIMEDAKKIFTLLSGENRNFLEVAEALKKYTGQRESVILLEHVSTYLMKRIIDHVKKGGVDKGLSHLLNYLDDVEQIRKMVTGGSMPSLALNRLIFLKEEKM